MKFSDIPKFTRQARYSVSQPWRGIDRVIQDWQGEELGGRLNLLPDFQRGHVWNEKQQIAYVEFRLKGGLTGRDIYFNHPGWMNSFKGDFVIVDGLQRLTAALRFIRNEIPAFGYKILEFEDTLGFAEVDFIFNVNDLKTRKEVLQWYIDFNSGGVVHTEEEIEKVRKLLEIENARSTKR